MKKKKKISLIIIVPVFVLLTGAFILTQIKDRTYFHSDPFKLKPGEISNTLVVYYSRSGNTEAMARQIARRMNAPIQKIQAPSYGLSFTGWVNAFYDSLYNKTTSITPEKIDLSKYRLIFLGSPVWLFYPAPPLDSFIEHNDFSGKKVVLFNTFNSRFKDEEINRFKRKISEKGGSVIDHIYVRRGRVYNQKSGPELIREVNSIVDSKKIEWEAIDAGIQR
ncbi:MAG: flavodoxin/nitric oxide synthase [bacterium]|nr:flavodoxin/nitric oxide synthase [bacterium]